MTDFLNRTSYSGAFLADNPDLSVPLTSDNKLLTLLGQAWNEYLHQNGLQKEDPDVDEVNDFRKCIHDAQRIVITKMYLSKK